MRKRFLTLVLALALCLGLGAPMAAHAATGGKLIALTFDDGPGPHTERLLDGLRARGVRATFFMVGQQVSRYSEVVSRVYREGHQVANHSYSHANLVNLSPGEVQNQILSTSRLLDQACGAGTRYLVRAPYGSTNDQVRAAVGAPLVYWAVDPQDWKYRNAATVRDRVVQGAADGAIILLHDSHPTSVDGALQAIDILQRQGYEFVTVGELFRRRGVPMENGVSYVRCRPTGTDSGAVAAPVLSSRLADGRLEVTIRAQPGAGIWYTVDGSDITQTSTAYRGPFLVSPPCTVRAVAAYDLNGDRSATVTQPYTLRVTQAPLVTLADGTLTLQGKTAGAGIFYTLDGSWPSEASTPYTGPVPVSPGTVVSACEGGTGYYTSPVSRAWLTGSGNVFSDVFPSSWYAGAVDQAVSAGLMNGTGDTCFSPEEMTGRAQFVTALYRASGAQVTQPERDACPFSDLEQGAYYTDAVCWASALSLVEGDDTGCFRPDDPITRQDMATILARYLASCSRALPQDGSPSFRDSASIAPWALSPVKEVTACGLMQGDEEGNFLPMDRASRAQTAAVMVRLESVLAQLEDAPGEGTDSPDSPEGESVPPGSSPEQGQPRTLS